MPKQKATIKITLPIWTGKSSAYEWRREVLHRLNKRKESSGAGFNKETPVEVKALVYMVQSRKGALGHDIDNFLKHIFDALQARRGGPKNQRRKGKLISNDRQVFKATIEKRYLKKRNPSGGQLTVRQYKVSK